MTGNRFGGGFLFFFSFLPFFFFPPVAQWKACRALYKKNILPYDLNNLANSQEYVILIATKVNVVNDSCFFCKSQLML